MIIKFFGLLVVATCLAAIYLFDIAHAGGSGLARILHWPAIVLTGIGPFGVVLMCSDLKPLREAFGLLFKRSAVSKRKLNEREADQLQELARAFYAQGARAFESANISAFSPHRRRMLDRLAVRTSLSDVEALVERERDRLDLRFHNALKLVGIGLRLSPSVGMLGTILGMVQLLSSLKDPSNIGGHMGLALLTTFYGLFFSIVLWTPLQQRLESLRDAELTAYDHSLHWLALLRNRRPAQFFGEAFEEPRA